MGDYLHRLMVQTGIEVESGSNTPQHSNESPPEGPMSDTTPGPIDVQEFASAGQDDGLGRMSDGASQRIQRTPRQTQAPSHAVASSTSPGPGILRPQPGTSSSHQSSSRQLSGDHIRSGIVDHTPTSHRQTNSSGRGIASTDDGIRSVSRLEEEETRTPPPSGHDQASGIDRSQTFTEQMAETSDNLGSTPSPTRSMNNIRGYLEALSPSSALTRNLSDGPREKRPVYLDVNGPDNRNPQSVFLAQPTDTEYPKHGHPLAENATSRSPPAGPEIRDLQLSIGSISVIVEGSDGDDGSTEFRQRRNSHPSHQVPSFESEGTATRRLGRHYIR